MKMSVELIETYTHSGEGYNPFFIRDNWQVAQLNHMPAQDLMGIEKMDRHLLTDEVFVLLKGVAVLIGAKEQGGRLAFQCIRMVQGVTYNIPVDTWHNIAMGKDAELIIVEKSNTHLGDFEYRLMSAAEKVELDNAIIKLV